MTDEDPRPLKSAGETPAELVRALRALGERDRDSARLARVAEQLGARIGSGATPTASWLRLLKGAKGLIGLVVGLGALGVLGYVITTNRRAPAPVAEIPVAPIAAAPIPAAVPATHEPALAPPSEPAQAPTPPAASLGGDRARVVRSTARSRADAPNAPSVAPAQAEPVPASTATEKPRPQQPAPADENRPPQPALERAPAQPSELALLHQARKVASEQPATALRLLREHSERFPNGTLTPEREMLTIEVLRKLGRSAEAAQRLQQFEVRYPNSIYLRRLEH